MAESNKRGVVLFIVLATLMIVIVLANVILNIMSSQSRLTHHQVSRIQSYYAAQAGMNLALERLRTGNWIEGSYCLGPTQASCSGFPAANTVVDSDIPYPVNITITAPDANGKRTLNITATYTYTP